MPQGAKFGIPNHPANSGRTLLLLQDRGLIKLNPASGLEATPLDVVENFKKIHFIELEDAQLARSLDDMDAAAMFSNFAARSGVDPVKDAIDRESGNSAYAVVLVAREQDQHRPELHKLASIYRSQVTKDFILSTFKGLVIPTW